MDWVERLTPWLLEANPMYLYLAVALYGLAEVLVPPLPGDVLVVFTGYLAGRRGLAPGGLVAAGYLGTMVALALAYAIGRLGREFLTTHRFWRKLFAERQIRRAEIWFARYGWLTLLVSRFLPGIRSPLVMVAGMTRYRPWAAFGLVSVSVLANVTLMVVGGRVLGANWPKVLGFLRYFGWGTVAAVLAVGVLTFGWSRLRRKADDDASQQ